MRESSLYAASSPSPRLQIAVHYLEVGVQVVQRLSHIQCHLAPPAADTWTSCGEVVTRPSTRLGRMQNNLSTQKGRQAGRQASRQASRQPGGSHLTALPRTAAGVTLGFAALLSSCRRASASSPASVAGPACQRHERQVRYASTTLRVLPVGVVKASSAQWVRATHRKCNAIQRYNTVVSAVAK